MFDIDAIQQALRDAGLDGWLLYDFRGSNELARRVLRMPEDSMGSRRCAYGIPATGAPLKLVHNIEDDTFDHLPGEKVIYLKWQEFEAGLQQLLGDQKQVAMEYSPENGNPYISKVDAGTIELVRKFGVEVVSSGDLIQFFEATWDAEQWAMHQEASVLTNAAFTLAWTMIAEKVRNDGGVEESDVCDAIMQHFHDNKMTTYHPPIVGRGPHSGMPHYETGGGENTKIVEGDFVLIDLWAKMDRPRSVYSDLTRTGFVGDSVPEKYTKIFNIVAAARDAGIETVERAFAANEPLPGGVVDDAVRKVIDDAGYGKYFGHRTGHSIGQEVHGNGAHLDNLETREDRKLMRQTCFSIEPGIYMEEFGVRSEVDVYVDADGGVHVTGGLVQTEVIPILRDY